LIFDRSAGPPPVNAYGSYSYKQFKYFDIFSVFPYLILAGACIILTVNYLINLYSVLVAKRFTALYNSPSTNANGKALKVLDHYRSVRRLLPIMQDGNHMGNHKGSKKKSFYATQGVEIR
jgi:hypothetical protein